MGEDMKYDFDTIVRRDPKSTVKWLLMKDSNPSAPDEITPFNIADMEYPTPPEIAEAVYSHMRGNILGYSVPESGYYDSVRHWMERKHGFSPKNEEFVITPGVVPALAGAVAALTSENASVIIMPPVYPPFRSVVTEAGRTVSECPLIRNGNKYEIDFELFEKLCENAEMFILCSPHNPVGRVWSEDELCRMLEICTKNGVFCVADEIHHDLIMPGYRHFSVGAMPEYTDNLIICTAPSKSFNLAGMHTANCFVSNPEKRNKLKSYFRHSGINQLGYIACMTAYDKCENWLDECISHIDSNAHMLTGFMKERMPEVRITPLEGTFLMWLDFSALISDEKELKRRMNERALFFADEGCIFGTGGRLFERVNIACPERVLKDALGRIAEAFNS